ncbi:MAG: hypothetical protein MHPSP_003016, partial [Paramarteilia canceri]
KFKSFKKTVKFNKNSFKCPILNISFIMSSDKLKIYIRFTSEPKKYEEAKQLLLAHIPSLELLESKSIEDREREQAKDVHYLALEKKEELKKAEIEQRTSENNKEQRNELMK